MEGDAGVTLTIRLIRSFEHRNVRNVVYKHVDLAQTTEAFQNFILQDLTTRTGLPPPFKKFGYDTLKVEHHAHGSKSNDPVINCEDDTRLMLQPAHTLASAGISHETEISFFRNSDYLKYKENPHTEW